MAGERPPRVALPAGPPPAQPRPPSSDAAAAGAPGPSWALAVLRAPPPTRAGDEQRETHSSLCHFPSWAAKGPRLQPPAPSLSARCVYSHFLPGPLENPRPAAPLMLYRWEQGSPLGPSPFLPWVSCSPGQPGPSERGASSKCRRSSPLVSRPQSGFRGDQGSPQKECPQRWPAGLDQPVLGPLRRGTGQGRLLAELVARWGLAPGQLRPPGP